MFEETVCKADKSRMMDEIIKKNLLDPERPVGLLPTGNTKQAKDKARTDADFDSPPTPLIAILLLAIGQNEPTKPTPQYSYPLCAARWQNWAVSAA